MTGAVRSMLKEATTDDCLPEKSSAFTSSRYEPSSVTSVPLSKGTPFNVAVTDFRFTSATVKVGVTVVETGLVWGSPPNVMTGGLRSRVKWRCATVRLPARSVASTSNVCCPSPATVLPLVNSTPSSRPTTLPTTRWASVAEKVTSTGTSWTEPSSTPAMETTGKVWSMVKYMSVTA
ncbi:hypothetical protein COEX109129_10075 [Corallococcus exiguus]